MVCGRVCQYWTMKVARKTHQVIIRHGREDNAEQRDDEVRLAQQQHRLVRRAVLERNEEVLALAGNEGECLARRDRGFGTE